MKLPTLYKLASSGATQVMNMEIIGDTYTRTWGQVDGAMQTKDTIAKGKNIGKINETSASVQAILEAEAVWSKKQKANYSTVKSAPVSVLLPMKVKAFKDQTKNVVYPCVSTPKLNGVNSTYTLKDGELSLTRRDGETYPAIPHLEKDVRSLMKLLKTNVLNGELYIHGEHLQDISSAVKKPNKLSGRLVFALFDIADSSDIYYNRRELMMLCNETTFIRVLTGVICKDINDIELHYNDCMLNSLEGTVIKNFNGLYVPNTRSSSQFKYKKAHDSEFKVTGHNIDKNGHTVFVCSAGLPFKVKLKGSNEERLAMSKIATTLYGKWLKVEFETYSKDGIPLKPVGIMFRECDTSGEPTE